MTDNQPQNEAKEATNKPASPSPSLTTNSPSRKRLLVDAKPKQGSATASPDSSLSSDSSSDRFRKKTRELPNFSDCHSCGLRINDTNPKDRLQTLDSVWRIVLLCKKCIKLVESAEICPYCFAVTSEKDCYRCRDCKRCIHRDCVVKYGGSAPWSYCCSESGFSVCVDCWVPKLLVNSVRVRRSRRDKKIAPNSCSLAESRVSVNSNASKSLEDVVKDANSAVNKKIAAAAKAKEKALRKAVVARRAVEVANNVLDLVTRKDENAVMSECLVTSSSSTDTAANAVVDDAELAFQLHRAMNSSPRISKNLCSINSSCLVVQKTRNCNRKLLDSRGSSSAVVCGKLEVCSNKELIEKFDTPVSESSVCFKATDSGSCNDLGNLKPETMTDMMTSLKGKECQENSALAVGLVGKCSSGDDNRMDSESQSCQNQCKSSHDLNQNDTGNQYLLKSDGNNTILHNGSCNGKTDRYLLKYSKRSISSKAVSSHDTKFLYDAFLLENHASAPGLPLNCSKESRTCSDVPFHMQAFACVSGSSREQP